MDSGASRVWTARLLALIFGGVAGWLLPPDAHGRLQKLAITLLDSAFALKMCSEWLHASAAARARAVIGAPLGALLVGLLYTALQQPAAQIVGAGMFGALAGSYLALHSWNQRLWLVRGALVGSIVGAVTGQSVDRSLQLFVTLTVLLGYAGGLLAAEVAGLRSNPRSTGEE